MEERQYLGKKTFWLFVIRKSAPAITLLCVATIFEFSKTAFRALSPFVGIMPALAFLSCLLFSVIALLAAWIQYRNYTFMLGEDAGKPFPFSP